MEINAAILTIAKVKLIFSPLLTIAIAVLGAYDVRKDAQLRREDLMSDMPLFLCLIHTLLEAGLQLPKSIAICSYAFKDSNGLSSEIRNLRAMMLSGKTASDSVENAAIEVARFFKPEEIFDYQSGAFAYVYGEGECK